MRDVLNFNGGWEFSKDNKDFKPVTLPHTWNGVDGQDGGNDYYRGKCCYKKSFAKSDLPSSSISSLRASIRLLRLFLTAKV